MKEQRTGGSYYIGSHCVIHWTKNSTIQLHLIIIIIQLIFLRMEPIEKVPKNAQLFNFRIWHFLSLCKGSFSIWCFQSWPTELIYSQLIPFAITHVYQTHFGIYHKSYHKIVTYHASAAPLCVVPIDFAGAILRHWNVHRSRKIGHYPKRK